MYVPQRPSLLPGSPADFVKALMNLHAHKSVMKNDVKETTQQVIQRCFDIGQTWGIAPDLWNRGWLNLSGGEGQRILLAIATSLNVAEILLLDGAFRLYFPSLCVPNFHEWECIEPTSALDSETSLMVENYLVDMVRNRKTSLKALIWITHSPEQGRRVGNRFISLYAGECHEGDGEAALLP